jgi:hypothetical protein
MKKLYSKTFEDKSIMKSIRPLNVFFQNPSIIEYSEEDTMKSIMTIINNLGKILSPIFTQLLINIGHIEILKNVSRHCLKDSVEIDSSLLNGHMESINKYCINSIINSNTFQFDRNLLEEEIKKKNQEKKDNIKSEINEKKLEEDFFKNIAYLLEDFGFVDKLKTCYSSLSDLDYLSFFLAILSFYEISNNFSFDRKKNLIINKPKNEDFDVFYFLNGVYLTLYQMEKKHSYLFTAFLTNFIKVQTLNLYSMNDFKNLSFNSKPVPSNLVILNMIIQQFSNNFTLDLIPINDYILKNLNL